MTCPQDTQTFRRGPASSVQPSFWYAIHRAAGIDAAHVRFNVHGDGLWHLVASAGEKTRKVIHCAMGRRHSERRHGRDRDVRATRKRTLTPDGLACWRGHRTLVVLPGAAHIALHIVPAVPGRAGKDFQHSVIGASVARHGGENALGPWSSESTYSVQTARQAGARLLTWTSHCRAQ